MDDHIGLALEITFRCDDRVGPDAFRHMDMLCYSYVMTVVPSLLNDHLAKSGAMEKSFPFHPTILKPNFHLTENK